MKKLLLALTCSALFAGLGSTAARAEYIDGYLNYDLSSFTITSAGAGVYDFSFSGAGQSGSGAFTTATTGTSGEFLITGISGTTDGSTITSLYSVAAAGDFSAYPSALGGSDNLLYFPPVTNSPNTNSAYLDVYGVSYALADGQNINLYYGVGQGSDPQVYNLLTGLPTPEPESLLLLGAGCLGLFAIVGRRRPRTRVNA
jgi:hypothetical protein